MLSPSLPSLNTSHVLSPSSASVCISPTTNSISDQLGSMTEQFKKIADAIEKINLEKSKVQVTSSPQSDDVEQMFYNIKCSNDLYMLKHLKINIQLDLITCIPCSKFKKQESKQRFRNLQQSLKVHY